MTMDPTPRPYLTDTWENFKGTYPWASQFNDDELKNMYFTNVNPPNTNDWIVDPKSATATLPLHHLGEIMGSSPDNYSPVINSSLLKVHDKWPEIKALGSRDAFTQRYQNNNHAGWTNPGYVRQRNRVSATGNFQP